jgi:hypothetical protein
VNLPQMPPDYSGVWIGVDVRKHRFVRGLPPGWPALTSFITLTCNFVLEWCDKIKLSNLLLPRKGGTIKSLQLLSTSGTLRGGSRGDVWHGPQLIAGLVAIKRKQAIKNASFPGGTSSLVDRLTRAEDSQGTATQSHISPKYTSLRR